ncbi:MAG TPA: cupredoxin domain-containing protein [Acidimicrobiia bacterium]
MFQRALATAVMAATAGTTMFIGAGPAAAQKGERCRSYAQVAHPFVRLNAEDGTFDTNCLTAPANRDFRIYLQNNDADPHNVSIYSADPSTDKKATQLYKGSAVKPRFQEEYAVDALAPGKYWFQDDKVKTMNGYVEIAGKK